MGAVALSSCPLQQKPDEPSSFKHFPDRHGLEINFSNKSMGVSLLSLGLTGRCCPFPKCIGVELSLMRTGPCSLHRRNPGAGSCGLQL